MWASRLRRSPARRGCSSGWVIASLISSGAGPDPSRVHRRARRRDRASAPPQGRGVSWRTTSSTRHDPAPSALRKGSSQRSSLQMHQPACTRSRRLRMSLRARTSGRAERGGLRHRPGGRHVDPSRRGRRLGRGAARRGDAAAATGVCEVLARARTVVSRASGRPARRLIEATVPGPARR